MNDELPGSSVIAIALTILSGISGVSAICLADRTRSNVPYILVAGSVFLMAVVIYLDAVRR